MMTRFEIARQIGSTSAGLFKPPGPDSVEEPAFPVLQNGLYFDGAQAALSTQTRAALDKATSPQDFEHAVPGLARIHALSNRRIRPCASIVVSFLPAWRRWRR